ncbi:DoxX family protein [Streptomyces phaeochromogenes]
MELFADIGVGQWLRLVTGILEIVGGIGLLVPRLSGVAAHGLVGVMGGALVTEGFLVDGSLVAPLVWQICAAIIAWFRRDPHTRADPTAPGRAHQPGVQLPAPYCRPHDGASGGNAPARERPGRLAP